MASNVNHNILDFLFTPKDCTLKTSIYWNVIQAHRHLFVSKLASKSYCEYALAQIKKLEVVIKEFTIPNQLHLQLLKISAKSFHLAVIR